MPQKKEKVNEQLLGVSLSGSDLPLLEVGLVGEDGFGGFSDLEEEKITTKIVRTGFSDSTEKYNLPWREHPCTCPRGPQIRCHRRGSWRSAS